MNEPQRQSYLKAMGLTPWVARVALPGAAPSPRLAMPEAPSPEAAAPLSSASARGALAEPAPPAPVSPPASSPASASSVPSPSSSPLSAALEPVPRSSAPSPTPTQPPPVPAAVAKSGDAVVFTLEAHLAGDTWLLFQQGDAKAPGLGRHEGALASALLALFSGRPGRPRRFYCPLTDDQPMNRDAASQALGAFLAGLIRLDGGQRALFCLRESLAGQVLGAERYQGFTLAAQPALVVSSLEEMLAEPAAHKKRSWQAMVAQGFHG